MPNKKEAIMEAFIQLLDENPTKRITVNDIVARCGVSRNTFYYYFTDIPALVNELESLWAARVRMPDAPRSIVDCIAPLAEYAAEHRKGLLHVYHTADRRHFQSDLDRLWGEIVQKYVDTAVTHAMDDADRALLVRYLKCIFVGMTLDWLEADMAYDLTAAGHRVCELLSAENFLLLKVL